VIPTLITWIRVRREENMSRIIEQEARAVGSSRDYDHEDKVWIDDVWLDSTDPPWGDHVDVVAEPDGDD